MNQYEVEISALKI